MNMNEGSPLHHRDSRATTGDQMELDQKKVSDALGSEAVCVGKQRFGPTGTLRLQYSGSQVAREKSKADNKGDPNVDSTDDEHDAGVGS
jgi:hypothetical protein